MRASHSTGPEVSTIGKYQLIANLGHGGMADVYLAIVHGLVGFNKLTVIKRLRPSLAEEPEFLAMFLDEARLAARLNHPNVVQTNEVAEVDGIYYIAMEYLDGQPLNRILHRVNKGPEAPPRNLLLRVVADALAGLQHAHELADYDGSPLCVVHRDASPHNIFVTYDGQTKVVDFGIAKAATRSAETRGGVLKGKIAYMAPEQARSDEVDRRADVFAMGLVLWEVLTGVRLRRGSDLELLDKIGSGDVPPLSSAWADCPAALAAIVARATALSKLDRYATANEMRQDILSYLDSQSERATQEEVGKLVSTLFDGKRAEMKAIIERQLSGLRRASTEDVGLRVVDARRLAMSDSSELPRVSLSSSPTGPATPSTTGTSLPRIVTGPTPSAVTGLTESRTSVSGATSTSTLASATGSSRMRAPILIVLAAAGAAATVLALRQGDGGASSSGVGAQAVSAAGSAAGPSSGGPAPAPATIELRLTARPEQAKMFLDDTSLGSNPFVGRFKRDELPHTLRIEAEGRTSVVRAISFASDQTLEVALEQAPPEASGKPTAEPSARVDAPRPQQGTGPAPGDTVPRPNRPKKQLDGDDPWQ